jgi:hypothetical protein
MGMMLRRYHHKGTKGITTSADVGAQNPGAAEAGTKPGAKANKGAWVTYAEGLGLDVTGLTVAKIQSAVSDHEASQEALVKEGAADVQETTEEQIAEAEASGVDVSGPSEDEIKAQEAAGAPDPGATNPDSIGQ